MEARRRRRWIIRSVLVGLPLLSLAGCWSCMISMPGRSWSGPLPELAPRERDLERSLHRDVTALAGGIGHRNQFAPSNLEQAARYIEGRFREAGAMPVPHAFTTSRGECRNIEVERRGASLPDEIVVVGAHYDSVFGCPGANDNATGVAGLLALAERFAKTPTARTLRFVAFVNEEPPFFRIGDMGSGVYAKRCLERNEKVTAMVSLETIGHYSDRDGSQNYPFPLGLLYPSKGNFIAFVGNVGSRSLVRRAIGVFRANASIPSEGAALPSWLPGVGWSDHESFWSAGYPAIMVTDTAPFRSSTYHTRGDTPDTIDYARCARVVSGVESVIQALANR
jgi:hypothetical protein